MLLVTLLSLGLVIIQDIWYYLVAKHQVLGNGTHVIMGTGVGNIATENLAPEFGKWYKSKEIIDGKFPFGGPLTIKNWYGNEVRVQ